MQNTKIRVNAISPGYLSDGMTLKSYKNKKLDLKDQKEQFLNRWGKASDVFGMIDYLISDKSFYTTRTRFYNRWWMASKRSLMLKSKNKKSYWLYARQTSTFRKKGTNTIFSRKN